MNDCCETYYNKIITCQGKSVLIRHCPICGADFKADAATISNEESEAENAFFKMMVNIHSNAKKHGWWDKKRSFEELIALCHAELSEALEEYRNGHGFSETYFKCLNPDKDKICLNKYCAACEHHKPEGIPTELADVIIRILDLCCCHNIGIYKAIVRKMKFNETRPFKHGGKVI